MKTFFLDYKKKLYLKLDELKLIDFNIFLAISGWSDSMFMFYVLQEYFKIKNIEKNKINILHFNHKYRHESNTEKIFLQEYFKDYNFIYWEYDWNNFTEENLRKARYDFFSQNIQMITIEKSNILCLWHNLDDRIETTFLNIVRGCSLEWFLNMDFFSQWFMQKAKNEENSKTNILRPIIYLPKFQIKKICQEFQIKYFEDITNLDNTISLRNFVRNEIISKFIQISNKNKQWIPKFYDSFEMIYNQLKNIQQQDFILENIKICENWDAYYWYLLKNINLEIKTIVNILKYLWIYFDISQTMLQDFLIFLQNSTKGYKYLNGVYFFKSHGQIYIIKAGQNFRQKKLAHIKKIDKIWIYEISWIKINIDDKKYIWWKLRFMKEGDVYRSKNLNKYFINKKIPIFWRNFIPLVIKDWEIQKVFTDIINR